MNFNLIVLIIIEIKLKDVVILLNIMHENLQRMKFKNLTLDKIKGYQKYFEPEKFWGKLKKYAKIIGKETVYHVLLLFYLLKSPQVSWLNKAYIAGALGYLIFPLDFIPDAIPIVGYSDDFAAIMMVFTKVKGSITPEIETQAREKLSEWFNNNSKAL